MSQLIIIQPDGRVSLCTEFPSDLKQLAVEMGFKKPTYLEHVAIIYANNHAHLFVDEDGRNHRLPFNEVATRLTAGQVNGTIVGPAAIWTGRLE